MAPKLLKVPLAVSLKERLKDKIRQNKAHRLAPPTATHMATVHRLPAVPTEPAEPMPKKKTRKVYSNDFKAKLVAAMLKAKENGESVQAVPMAEGVKVSLAYNWMTKAKADPMAKKKRTMTSYDAEYRAKIVARALEAIEKKESVSAIAKSEGLYDSNIWNWIKAAKKANGALPAESREENRSKPGRKPRGTIESLSRELSEALARVDTLKVKLRKLLE